MTATHESPGDIYHVTRDEEYLRQLEAEATFWDRPHFFNLDLDLPTIGPYLNERFTGDAGVSWIETIPTYGTFRRGCVVGTGGLRQEARLLEQNPSLHVTFLDMSEESLAARERELGGRFPGRVETRQADLNFVELPEDAYDLIVSSSCLHHLLNLEHISYQINRSLTPDGYFFLHDYVGEARCQFTKEKKRLFESLLQDAKGRHPFLRSWRVEWSDLANWQHSPFEAVRSDETLEVLRRYLTEVTLHAAGGLLVLLLWLRPAPKQTRAAGPGRRRRLGHLAARVRGLLGNSRGAEPKDATMTDVLARLGPELSSLDRALSDAGILRPAVAFAVYRKKQFAGLPGRYPPASSEERG